MTDSKHLYSNHHAIVMNNIQKKSNSALAMDGIVGYVTELGILLLELTDGLKIN